MRRQWVYLIPKKRNTHGRLLAAVVAIMAFAAVAAVAFRQVTGSAHKC